MKNELLIEILSEEIPARMQKNAESGFYEIMKSYLEKNKINYDEIITHVGPRRITLVVRGLPSSMQTQSEEIRGPKIGSPEAAIEGFCRSNNISKNALAITKIKEHEYYVYHKETSSLDIKEILKHDLPKILFAYTWPKSMLWNNYEARWVRPIRNILCLFSGHVLDFKYFHLTANNKTYGHRFLANELITVKDFKDYEKKLHEHYVLLSRSARLDKIEREIEAHCAKLSVQLKKDEELLDEVVGLNEYPTILPGKIEERFLEVPSEALIASIRNNQKYFNLLDKQGNFSAYFLFASNVVTDNSDNADDIVAGNQKVLSARLADALYFYKHDIKQDLLELRQKLKHVVFHAKIGSLFDKTTRLQKICEFIGPNDENAKLAAIICKSDIVSEMVGEFPELQGVMGSYYALAQGYNRQIANAIENHYKPLGPADTLPISSGAILAIADKIDTICAIFCAGEKPTGSKDPYALRRQVLGIVRIILENKLTLDLHSLVGFVAKEFDADTKKYQEIMEFIIDRVRNFFKEQYDAKYVNLVFGYNDQNLDIIKSLHKLKAIATLDSKLIEQIVSAAKRTSNILTQEEIVKKEVQPELFQTEFENELFVSIIKSENDIKSHILANNYEAALYCLVTIATGLSSFFENVMVHDVKQDRHIIENKLALIASAKNCFDSLAEFHKL